MWSKAVKIQQNNYRVAPHILSRTPMKGIVERLHASSEPCIRYKTLVEVLSEDPNSNKAQNLQDNIKTSPRVRKLLSERTEDGRIPYHPYAKWDGAHWVLAMLAEIGYPEGDENLLPLRTQVYEWLLSKGREQSMKKSRVINGRVRNCASQEGNALFSLLKLGLADKQTDKLAERLVQTQWPDGGWNCDKRPEAVNSSFNESIIPLRALALHAKIRGDSESKAAAERAANIFLKRRLFRRQRDGSVIHDGMIMLHYPAYWHYDILYGLKVMRETGHLEEEGCGDALNLLESKRLVDGGFPAEGRYFRVSERKVSSRSLVDWGETSKTRLNEFVTVEALGVLTAVGET
jgi:hypothetical protein